MLGQELRDDNPGSPEQRQSNLESCFGKISYLPLSAQLGEGGQKLTLGDRVLREQRKKGLPL